MRERIGAQQSRDNENTRVDLDQNATTKPLPEVVSAVTIAMRDAHHNPSSLHKPGQHARSQLERARASIANLIEAQPDEIVFAATGTESITLAITSAVENANASAQTMEPTPAVITSSLEHAAVLELCEKLKKTGKIRVFYAAHTASGVVEPNAVRACIEMCNAGSIPVALVTIHGANNETGAIQPIAEIAKVCAQHNVCFHTDATQLVGKLPCDVNDIGADMLSFSLHKFHGPRGVGVLYVRTGTKLVPMFPGAQEQARRAGTENVAAVVGAAVACDHARAWMNDPAIIHDRTTLRRHLESELHDNVGDVHIHCSELADNDRLWNTVNVAILGAPAEQMLIMLSEHDICASAGAACSSGSVEPSRVLRALAVGDDMLSSSIRLSFGRTTSRDEIDRVLRIIASCAQRLRSFHT